jgi:DNA invertase Pin-like site-specific DNA recombinase
MHPRIATGNVAIYARYSSDLQSEASLDDQIRRGREVIARAGGNPIKAMVFPDSAISGASMQRPGLEALMRAVEQRQVDVILTEDISRISRDMGDAAQIFKLLQFADVPLISISDGIDTSHKHAKMNFAVKSLMADMYLDDLRDKTLRGLEGRALAGLATGSVPYGYTTVAQADRHGRSTGHQIVIDEEEAAIVRRIFEASRDGTALRIIARTLNRGGTPSPRAGSRHKRFGWGASTIRAMLYNERYAGTWRFKERQWVKVPGTNKRVPRPRPADEVITLDRPDLRIIEPALWAEVQARLLAVHRRYAKGVTDIGSAPRALMPRKGTYLLSGIVVCDECGAPLTICGGSPTTYYQCSTWNTKGTCSNDLRIRETALREDCLGAIREQIQTAEAIEYVHVQLSSRLGDQPQTVAADLRQHRERLGRTDDRIKGLVTHIAEGDRSEAVVGGLRALEAEARLDRAAIERLEELAKHPAVLPTIDELTAAVFEMEHALKADPDTARGQLRSWLEDGEIRVRRTPEGYVCSGVVYPLRTLLNSSAEKNSRASRPLGHSLISVRSGGRI